MLLAGQSGEEATFARTSPSGSLFEVLFDKQNSAMMVIGDSDDEGCYDDGGCDEDSHDGDHHGVDGYGHGHGVDGDEDGDDDDGVDQDGDDQVWKPHGVPGRRRRHHCRSSLSSCFQHQAHTRQSTGDKKKT